MRLIFLIVALIFLQSSFAQRSYRISTDERAGVINRLDLDDNRYIIFRTIPSGEPITDKPILRLDHFDDCGIIESYDYTYPDLYGIRYIISSQIDGDSIRVAMMVNPKVIHNHSEFGVLSIHKENFGHRYQCIRAENVIHPRTFIVAGANRYFAHMFLSYTDKPIQYGSFLLDKEFNILKYYENFTEYTVTAGAIKLADGYICGTSEQLYKLNLDLIPVWRKEISSNHFMNNLIDVGDGIVFRLRGREWPNPAHTSVVKVDYNGNILWQTDRLNTDEEVDDRAKLVLRSDGMLEIVVQNLDEDYYSNRLFIYTIDPEDGSIVRIQNIEGNDLSSSFQFNQYHIGLDGQRTLMLREEGNGQVLWNISEEGECALFDGGFTEPTFPLTMVEKPNRESVLDNVWTSTYEWQRTTGNTNLEEICLSELMVKDLLPDDTIACTELGLTLNLSDQDFNIIWEDGSLDKVRLIDSSGTYSYRLDHCEIEFEESIDVQIETCTCQFYLPNIFTPDGDGNNEFFEAFHKCPEVKDFSIQIFDRWGESVYTNENPKFKWDGTFGGQPLPNGVYSYLVTFVNVYGDGIQEKKTGTITIMR